MSSTGSTPPAAAAACSPWASGSPGNRPCACTATFRRTSRAPVTRWQPAINASAASWRTDSPTTRPTPSSPLPSHTSRSRSFADGAHRYRFRIR
jgi:hypothetical protein